MRGLRRLFARALDHGDRVLVALLATSALLDGLLSGRPVADAALVTAIALPLLLRRRAPLAALALVVAATYAGYSRGPGVGGSLKAWIAINVALYGVGAHCGRERA